MATLTIHQVRKNSLNIKFSGGIFLGHPGPRRRDIPDKNFMQVPFFFQRAQPSVTFGVSFFAVFLGYSFCTEENVFYCLQGRSEGLLRKMTLVFPCFALYATHEQVSLSHGYMGRFPGNSPVLTKYPTENDTLKMTLGRARFLLF